MRNFTSFYELKSQITKLRKEEQQKSLTVNENIEKMNTEISSLSDTTRAIEEIKAEDALFLRV